MIPTPPDLFDEWFRLPVVVESSDPRFEVRRAKPEEFDRIYDVVDSAFGKKRPRVHFDWLYRNNPFGRARCWIVIERASGAVLKTGAGFPWPIWRGAEALKGTLSGDSCTVPEWQRKGLAAVRRAFTRKHPWYEEFCGIAGPNEGSRIVTTKAGEGDELLGALRGGVMPLRAKPLLARLGAAPILARPIGAAADAVLSSWQGLALRGGRTASGRIERIGRFTTEFDDVTERCMAWPQFWSPHNAGFLNWRYLDHPVESYVGLALVENERPTAYAVLCLERDKATLTEFAVEAAPRASALKLLAGAMGLAREAGCASVNFFGPPGWRHWNLFHRAGFLPYRTKNHLEAFGKRFEPEVFNIHNWQVTPGDRDFR